MKDEHFEMSMSNYATAVTFKLDYPDVTTEDVMAGIVGCMRALTWSDDQILRMCIDYIEEHDDYKVIHEDDQIH